ncbi:hypothetical protein GCM10029963_74640 [Micromonospora andamanensis]
MGGEQDAADLGSDGGHPGDREWTVFGDQVRQGDPVDLLEDRVGVAGVLAEVVDGGYAGVVEAGGEQCLAAEAADQLQVRGSDELDDHRPVEQRVVRWPDLTHSLVGQWISGQSVAVLEVRAGHHGAQHNDRTGHRRAHPCGTPHPSR